MRRTAIVKRSTVYIVNVEASSEDSRDILEEKALDAMLRGDMTPTQSEITDIEWLPHNEAEYRINKAQEKPVRKLPTVNFTVERNK